MNDIIYDGWNIPRKTSGRQFIDLIEESFVQVGLSKQRFEMISESLTESAGLGKTPDPLLVSEVDQILLDLQKVYGRLRSLDTKKRIVVKTLKFRYRDSISP
jgi:hypothetical protein